MVRSGKKRLIFTAIAVSLVGIVTGLMVGSDLLLSQTSNHQYGEKPTSSQTETMFVEHSHDGLPMHKHQTKVTVTTMENTPHGYFHYFAPTTASGITPAPTTPGAAPATMDTTQTATNATQTKPTPTKAAYVVWLAYGEVIPVSITVPAGATVTWANKDPTFEHTVTFDNGLLDARLAPGTSFNHTFTEAGTFTYHCEPHPHLIGEVIVK